MNKKDKNGILSAMKIGDNVEFDATLRPKTLDEYIGQEKIKENLRIFIQAAKQRKEPLEHILFFGPPGLGKTTMANITANTMGVNIRYSSGPLIERAGDLAAILTNLEDNSILFIDEIHRLPHVVEEVLYPAMEDCKLDIVIGKGPSARTITIELPKFTLIGATTRAGLLTGPLRDRFGITFRMDFYPVEDLKKIIERSSKILKIKIDKEGVEEVAKRSRGTPRVANRLLKRVRDYAQVKGVDIATKDIVDHSLQLLDIDAKGLDLLDRKVMEVIINQYNGGPVGIDSIAVSVSEESDTIEDVCEPFLLQLGFLIRTPQGRKATEQAYKHFGKKWDKCNEQGRLL